MSYGEYMKRSSQEELLTLLRDWISPFSFLVLAVFMIDRVWSLAIFSQTNSFSTLRVYMGGVFWAMPVGVLVSVWLFSRGWLKICMYVMAGLSVIFLTLVLFFKSLVMSNLFVLGLIYGLINAFLYFGGTMFVNGYLSTKEGIIYGSRTQRMYAVYALVIPGLVYLSEKVFGGFELLFGAAQLSLVIGIFFLVRTKIEHRRFEIGMEILNPWGNFGTERLTLVALGLMMGIKSAIFWAFMSVMILHVLGGIGWWVIASVVMQITGMISVKIYSSFWKPEIMDELLVAIGVLYAGVTVVLAVNMSPAAFFLFSLVDVVFNTLFVMYWGYVQQTVIRMDKARLDGAVVGYSLLGELSIAIGRIVSFVLLAPVFVVAADRELLTVSALVFLMVSVLPLVMYRVLRLSKIFALKEAK